MGFSVGLDIGALAGGAMTAGGSIVQGYWNKQQQEKSSVSEGSSESDFCS